MFLVKAILTLVMSVFCVLPAMAESTVKITKSQTDIVEQNVKVDPNDGVGDFPLAIITVRSEGGPTKITGFYVGSESLSAVPATLRIYSNQSWDPIGSTASTVMGSISGDVTIAADTAVNFTLSGDFSSQTTGWCVGRIRGIRVEENGVSKDILTPLEIHGPERRFFGGIATWILADAPAISTTRQNGKTTSMTAVFTLQVTADGLSLAQPTGKDFLVMASSSPNNSVLCDSVAASVVPNGPITDGSTATVVVTATVLGTSLTDNAPYGFSIRQINWGASSSSQVTQYWGLEGFKTWTPAQNFNPDIPPAKQIAAPFISANLYQAISTLGQADDFGLKGQLVGEGGFLRFTPLDANQSRTVVFPYPASPDKGQLMRPSVAINAVDMTPIISAPANLLGTLYGSFRQYPISNVINTTSGGVTTKTTFDVTIGDLTFHGKFVRTGDGSCVAVFYWGPGSSPDSVGEKMDLITLSPSFPNDGNLPARFKFKSSSAGMSGNSCVMSIVSLPFSFKVQGSNDLVDWKDMTYWSYSYDATTLDESGSMQGLVYVDMSMLSTLNLNPARCFFKIVSLD